MSTDRIHVLEVCLYFLLRQFEQLSSLEVRWRGFVQPAEQQRVLGYALHRHHQERVEVHAAQHRVLHLRDAQEDLQQLFLFLQIC